MTKKTVLACLACLLLSAAIKSYGADINLDVTPIIPSPETVSPGQTGISVVSFSAVNTTSDTQTLNSIAFTYTGSSAGDVALVHLIVDGGTLASKPLSDGIAWFSTVTLFEAGASHTYVITVDLASSAANGDFVKGQIDKGGIEPAGTVESRAINSLDGKAYTVVSVPVIHATHMSVSPALPGSFTAGVPFHFTVSCVDDSETVDPDYSVGSLTFSGTAGVSPDGTGPSYSGGGPWSGTGGARACSITFYRAQSGVSVTLSSPDLPAITAGGISVAAGPTAAIGIASVGNQQAGVPFAITLQATDGYGNRSANSFRSLSTVTSDGSITASPGGSPPVFPQYRWTGTEPSGQKTLVVIAYCQSPGARLRVVDSALDGSLSNAFVLAPGSISSYLVSAAASAGTGSAVPVTVNARDTWGNILAGYAGTGRIICSDPLAIVPVNVPLTGGAGAFTVIFRTWGAQTVTVRDNSLSDVRGAATVNINRPAAAKKFMMNVPSSIAAGRPFNATVSACDDGDEVVTSYTHAVTLSVPYPAAVTPSSVFVASGTWRGTLAVSGEMLAARLSASDSVITTVDDAVMQINVPGFEKARTYPTVFTPRDGPVRIRYFLREDRTVTVRIYNALMDPVREFTLRAGENGGRQGLNVVEWDGKGGDSGTTGHSGGYHIRIDKGYENEWTGAVIKNY